MSLKEVINDLHIEHSEVTHREARLFRRASLSTVKDTREGLRDCPASGL